MSNVEEKHPRLLKLADYSDPVLHHATQKIHFPLSQEDKQLIEDMKYSIQSEQLKKAGAPWDAAVGMAANQWGFNKRIFLYCPTGDAVNDLQVIINPSYEPLDAPKEIPNEDLIWEGCFSVPLATGNVQRYTHIRATYQNEAGETLSLTLSGWPARVWQHENDHLNGFLYDNKKAGKCVEFHRFQTKEEVEKFHETVQRRPASEAT